MSINMIKLLIADDEPWIIENLKTMINWADFSIELLEPAVDGEDALAKFSKHKPELIITDINMPFLDGNEFVHKAKEICPDVQVIILSGYNDFSYVREGLLNGVLDYLLKPVSKSSLTEVLNKAISKISDKNRFLIENAEQQERLIRAGSLISDTDYSQLLKGVDFPDKEALVSQLELEYSMFHFSVIRLIDMNTLSQKSDRALHEIIFSVKKEVERFAGNEQFTVFNNIYSRSEFVLFLNTQDIRQWLLSLSGLIERRFGTRVRVCYSGHLFSFEEMSQVYGRCKFTMSLRSFNDSESVVPCASGNQLNIRNRIRPEQEKKLLLAVETGNRMMARSVILDDIGFNKKALKDWQILEVSQAVDHLYNIFLHSYQRTTDLILSMENYYYLISRSIDEENSEELCQLIEQIIDEVIPVGTKNGSGKSMESTIQDVCSYIDENYFKSLSLSSLSSLFSIDRSYLCRSFKSVTGENLMLSISRKRIEKAVEYIRESVFSPDMEIRKKLSLTEISDLVGYEEYSYFNRVFRKITGQSPSSFKKSLKTKEGQ